MLFNIKQLHGNPCSTSGVDQGIYNFFQGRQSMLADAGYEDAQASAHVRARRKNETAFLLSPRRSKIDMFTNRRIHILIVPVAIFIFALLTVSFGQAAGGYAEYECNNCGNKFKATGDKINCPKCKSYDVCDVAVGEETPVEETQEGSASKSGKSRTKNQQPANDGVRQIRNRVIDGVAESVAGIVVNSIVGSDPGSKTGSGGNNGALSPSNQARKTEARTPSTAGTANGIVCSKCMYSAVVFPYADKKKTHIRCPSCGEKMKIK